VAMHLTLDAVPPEGPARLPLVPDSPAALAAYILATPVLRAPETPQENIRNALAILNPLLLVLPREYAEDVKAAIDRLWRAVEQLEGRAQ
jgi:hypothetical protein